MTREDAVLWLLAIKKKYIHGGDEGYDEKRKEAIDMAVELLRQNIESKYYKEGLNDAWECVKKIVEGKVDIEDVFGDISYLFLFRKYSAQEAMNKIREYEEKHKHKACSIIEDDCPYEIECEDCEVFCSVERAKKRLGKK